MKLAFLNQKGGVGKTTLAVNTIIALQKQKRKVIAIDLDPQESMYNFFSRRNNAHFDYTDIFLRYVNDIASDDVVIDTAGIDNESTRNIIFDVDIVIMPLLLSQQDIDATESILKSMRDFNINTTVKCVFNRIKMNDVMMRYIETVKKRFCKEYNVSFLSDIKDRNIYRLSFATNNGVIETKNNQANQEIKKFVHEQMEDLND